MSETKKIYSGFYLSPVGFIKINGDDDFIVSVEFVNQIDTRQKSNALIEKALFQIKEYFEGKRFIFDLPLNLTGTEFQKKVWNELLKIKYGNVKSYKEIAVLIGNPKSYRAVGNANNKNKIAIIVPCHRVINESGELAGYAGGIERKKWFLNHEAFKS